MTQRRTYLWGIVLAVLASAALAQPVPVGGAASLKGYGPTQTGVTNLLGWSNTFSNAAWTKQAGVALTANATAAPDGTNTGWQLDWTSTAAGSGIYSFPGGGVSVPSTANNTKSVYVRAPAAGGTVLIQDPNQFVSSATMTLTTAWQRLALSETQPSGKAGIWLQKTASSPSVIFIADAQIEAAPAAKAYVATGSASAANLGVAAVGFVGMAP